MQPSQRCDVCTLAVQNTRAATRRWVVQTALQRNLPCNAQPALQQRVVSASVMRPAALAAAMPIRSTAVTRNHQAPTAKRRS
jgi:hypothetical protein